MKFIAFDEQLKLNHKRHVEEFDYVAKPSCVHVFMTLIYGRRFSK